MLQNLIRISFNIYKTIKLMYFFQNNLPNISPIVVTFKAESAVEGVQGETAPQTHFNEHIII